MLVLLITNSNSHFFDDANVLPTDTIMLRRSTDDLSNVSDTDGNTPDKVIIDGYIGINPLVYIDMLSKLKDNTQILLRFDQCCTWYSKEGFIELMELGLEYFLWE